MAQHSKATQSDAAFPAHLLKGYAAFRKGDLAQNKGIYADLAEHGQKPPVMLIGCCDSRAAPETIFSARPGEIFVLRNVANIVPPHDARGADGSVASALEFAILALKVRHVVVMGHSLCGGVAAFRQGLAGQAGEPLSPDNLVAGWIRHLSPLAEQLGAADGDDAAHTQRRLEELSVRQSVENLKSFPFIADLAGRNELSLHGAWFDVANGELRTMDPETGSFSEPNV